jgi:Carboxypeptidase regulatory-like domain
VPRAIAICALVAVSTARTVAAQQPARLPAVVVNAAPDKPGARKLAGVVRDTGAFAIDSVEVSIVSLQRRVFSKADGTFLFTDVKPGTYEVRARKLGYGPQVREMVVDTAGATGMFSLVPLSYLLRPVVTTVSRGGLSGVVGDTAFNALPGAEVRVLGHEQHTVTDSSGSFYMPIRSGSYVVAVKDAGFTERLVSVIVPSDSGERIRVTLAPLTHALSVREVHNVDDLGERLAWRNNQRSRVFTHADLVDMKIEWLYDAIQIGYHQVHAGPPGMLDEDCIAMVNGGPDTATVGKLTVDDVETVEIYDTRAPARPTRRRPITPMPMSNTEIARGANSTKACALVYVWLR